MWPKMLIFCWNNTGTKYVLVESDLLSNYCEIFSVTSGLSQASNASDGSRIGLQTSLKRTPNCGCTLQWIVTQWTMLMNS